MALIPDSTIAWHRNAGFEKRGTQITYGVPSRTIDYGAGTISNTWTDTVIYKAIKGPTHQGESRSRTYEVRTADLPVSVERGHRIVDGSETWLVQTSTKSQTGYSTFIQCEQV